MIALSSLVSRRSAMESNRGRLESGDGWIEWICMASSWYLRVCMRDRVRFKACLLPFTRGRVPKTWRARKAVLYLLSRGEIDSLRTPKESARVLTTGWSRAEAVLTARVSLRSRQVRQPSETGITCVWSCTASSRRWITAAYEERQCVVR